MSRPIKFRAWDIRNECWAKAPLGLSIDFDGELWRLSAGGVGQIKVSEKFALQQFTGLLDRNGKEIYEGDIVKMDDQNFECYWNTDSHIGGWNFRPDHYDWRDIAYSEVIGNIYENVELSDA